MTFIVLESRNDRRYGDAKERYEFPRRCLNQLDWFSASNPIVVISIHIQMGGRHVRNLA